MLRAGLMSTERKQIESVSFTEYRELLLDQWIIKIQLIWPINKIWSGLCSDHWKRITCAHSVKDEALLLGPAISWTGWAAVWVFPSSSDAFDLSVFVGIQGSGVMLGHSGLTLDAVVSLPLLSLAFGQVTDEAILHDGRLFFLVVSASTQSLSIPAPQKFQLPLSEGMKAHQLNASSFLCSRVLMFLALTCCTVQLLLFMLRQPSQKLSGVIWKLNTQRSVLIKFILYKFFNHLFQLSLNFKSIIWLITAVSPCKFNKASSSLQKRASIFLLCRMQKIAAFQSVWVTLFSVTYIVCLSLVISIPTLSSILGLNQWVSLL